MPGLPCTCPLHRSLRRFLPERARALGVPFGPLCGQLKAGQSVRGADGRTVHSFEVKQGACRPQASEARILSAAGLRAVQQYFEVLSACVNVLKIV